LRTLAFPNTFLKNTLQKPHLKKKPLQETNVKLGNSKLKSKVHILNKPNKIKSYVWVWALYLEKKFKKL
jgi:hypothetical protein